MAKQKTKSEVPPEFAPREIRPQPGPQEAFLASEADIAVYGGGAGGGKTVALLLDPLRNLEDPLFQGVIFRRTSVMIRSAGGLWDESMNFFPLLGGEPTESRLKWRFPAGMEIKFNHLEHEKNRLDHQGAQYSWIGWDELTHFTESQFFYLLSRLRSMSEAPGRVRATCNPDPDSWVAKFLEWWIDQDTGLAIPKRAGVLRYFIRDGDTIVWGDSHEELAEKYDPKLYMPKSVTFIPATVHDNKILLEKKPEYLATLMSLPMVERERLLGGNWKVRPAAGKYFRKDWFEIVEVPPRPATIVRGWDLAATEPKPGKDPDWTVGLKLSEDRNGVLYVEDVARERESPAGVERMLVNTATQDTETVVISLPQDPGQAGKFQANYFIKKLKGYRVTATTESGDKVTRAGPASSQAQARNIKLVRGPWNEAFLKELEAFPQGAHDDQVDALSRAFAALLEEPDNSSDLVW